MQIKAFCPIWGQSGYEVLSRGILLALDKLGVTVQIVPKDDWNREDVILSREEEARLIRMCNAVVAPDAVHLLQQYPNASYLASQMYRDSKKQFCFSLFETNKCPTPWVPLLNQITETWVFSEFNRKTYANSGVINTHIIPFGIDTNMFKPSGDVLDYSPKREGDFVFLTNGDFTERKNFEGLIEAYVKEFTNEDKVCLIIKTHSNGFIKRYKDICEQKIREIVERFNSINPPRILFLGSKLPYYELPKLYRASDCFVLCSRGEGLGIPYAEALACGVGVISTTFGGQMQFLNNKNSLFVDSEIKVIDDLEYLRKCIWAANHSWAHSSINSVRDRLRLAFEMKGMIQEKGIQGRKDILKLTWQKVALAIIERIGK